VPPAKSALIRGGLETLYFSGVHTLLQPFCAGVGAILMLHHVRPARDDAFQPNRLLEVTPAFLEAVILRLRDAGIELVSLDEMHRRLVGRDFGRRFACVTFDDGYRDNKQYAYPVLKKHAVPFAVYVPTSFMERTARLWWIVLENVIAGADRVDFLVDGDMREFACDTVAAKRQLYDKIYWWLRGLPAEDEIRMFARALAERYRVDMPAICDRLCMSWQEVAELALDPLVTIGAHTVSHPILAKEPADAVRREMETGRSEIAATLGRRPEHFAYPFGDKSAAGPREFGIAAELGFKTAVTTRPGMLFAEHGAHLTALPRISLNGEFQQDRYLRVLLSGVATALWNGFRRVDAA
jgi:peptidoglycan/xylan/chitin deacetylase (PgdA/CDA1 family)